MFLFIDPITVSNKLGGDLLKQELLQTDSSIIIPSFDFSIDANIYPNPLSKIDITVDYIAGNVTKVSFLLYNTQGLLMTEKEVEGNGIVSTKLNTKDLPSGFYTLFISDGVKQIRKNIMVY